MPSVFPGLRVVAPRRRRLIVRHYCHRCHGRVFPFDKYEALTESPAAGSSGYKVLLTSANARDPEHREAWCFSCKRWVHARRLTEQEFLKLYLQRKGVSVRPFVPKKKRKRKRHTV